MSAQTLCQGCLGSWETQAVYGERHISGEYKDAVDNLARRVPSIIPLPGGSAPGEEVLTGVFSYYILMTGSIHRRTTSSDGSGDGVALKVKQLAH